MNVLCNAATSVFLLRQQEREARDGSSLKSTMMGGTIKIVSHFPISTWKMTWSSSSAPCGSYGSNRRSIHIRDKDCIFRWRLRELRGNALRSGYFIEILFF